MKKTNTTKIMIKFYKTQRGYENAIAKLSEMGIYNFVVTKSTAGGYILKYKQNSNVQIINTQPVQTAAQTATQPVQISFSDKVYAKGRKVASFFFGFIFVFYVLLPMLGAMLK